MEKKIMLICTIKLYGKRKIATFSKQNLVSTWCMAGKITGYSVTRFYLRQIKLILKISYAHTIATIFTMKMIIIMIIMISMMIIIAIMKKITIISKENCFEVVKIGEKDNK